MSSPSQTGTTEKSKSDSGGGNEVANINSRLNTDVGKITVAQNVVSKIAGMACREISGVAAMGIRWQPRVWGDQGTHPGQFRSQSVSQGVGVEVGETQAAIDLDIVIDYGVSVADLGSQHPT